MENLPKCYTVLFNTLTEVIEAIDRMDFGTARALLIRGQQEAEEAYASEEEEEPPPIEAGPSAGSVLFGDFMQVPVPSAESMESPEEREGTEPLPYGAFLL